MDGTSEIHMAVDRGDLLAIKRLIQNGAQLDVLNKDEWYNWKIWFIQHLSEFFNMDVISLSMGMVLLGTLMRG